MFEIYQRYSNNRIFKNCRRHNEVSDWLQENMGTWTYLRSTEGEYYYFENKKDAMFFKLTWCENV